MYLWHILHVDKKELLNILYSAHKLESSKDGWVEQITMDRMDLNIHLSDENIKLMFQDKFRLLVTLKTKE